VYFDLGKKLTLTIIACMNMNACPVHFYFSIELPDVVLLAPSLTHHLTAHTLHWFVYPTHVIIIFSRRRQSLHHIWCPECYTNAIHVRGTFGFDKFDVFSTAPGKFSQIQNGGHKVIRFQAGWINCFRYPVPILLKKLINTTLFFSICVVILTLLIAFVNKPQVFDGIF
jgi:hypothetical protein